MPGKFITIHGHFYQPPRENPWLEAVETQDSAFPWHDWNARITAECYEPNATARILDGHDRIRHIVNNYATISFNFGPTLLSWMERSAPETYAAVLEADQLSLSRFGGHGCALAQAYNHIILPLANPRDIRTQVRWGVRDFEKRFGRKPEGMWLPETAVDIDSLEALVEEGIAFTILEPHQAARHRKIGETAWHPAQGRIDPTMPYRCALPSGREIAIFFYDGPISRAVAFERLLVKGEHLANRLTGAIDEGRKHAQLVNIATDGETYGHHHRFGEMALAYALQLIAEQGNAQLTNYGEFLELHPPTHEVEITERTAWSCSHGIERWRSDCGCNTGGQAGWNQRWRGPLRDALDWLRGEVETLYVERSAGVLTDAWRARDAYVDVVLDRSPANIDAFLAQHAVPGADETCVLQLLEMQRNAMLMYTSCGWFFNDISGIETVQVLQYAGRVLQLAAALGSRDLEEAFLFRLEPAQSNLPEKGNPRLIYQREVAVACLDLARVAAHYAVLSHYETFDDDSRVYCYDVFRDDFAIYKAGRGRLAVGRITVRSTITREYDTFEFAALHLGETELAGGIRRGDHHDDYEQVRKRLADAMEPGGLPDVIRLLDTHFGEIPIAIRSLFKDEQRRVMQELIVATLEEAESTFRKLHERYDPLMRFHSRLGIPIPKILQTAAAFDLNMQLCRLLEARPLASAEIELRLKEAREESVMLDESTLMAFRDAIERAAERFHERATDLDALEELECLATLARNGGIEIDLRVVQNRYYRMRKSVRPKVAAAKTDDAARWIEVFDQLGTKLAME